MKKLIKLAEDHYIIVDDSEIKENDFYYLPKQKSIAKCPKMVVLKSVTPEWTMKITHSTTPFRKFAPLTINDMGLIYIPLSEIEEAVYGYSVEKMSRVKYRVQASGGGLYTEGKQDGLREGYIDGFKAHQELSKDKLFTIEDMQLLAAELIGRYRLSEIKEVEDMQKIINSILPKTEWDIEFDEKGKIKLI